MIDLLKKWAAPPYFALDEEKSRRVWMINTVQLHFLAALIITALVLIPLHMPRKSESYAILLTMLLLNGISRYILFRGHPKTASTLMISVAWVLFTGAAAFSGGTASPFMFALVATAIASGLLINPRIGTIFVVLSALAGLGIALLQENGLLLEKVFVYSPIADWFLFALGLIFVHILMNLVLNDLERVLARERQHNAARQLAEQALRQSEERFQMFMRHFPGLAYMKDSSGQILFVNQGFQTYLGLNPDEMIGKTSPAVFGQEFGEKIEGDDQRILKLGISQDIQEEFNGKTWITHKFTIHQPGASPLLGGITIDTTERVQAEEKLRASENRFKQMFAQAPIAINITHGTEITYANPAYLKMFGFSSLDEIKQLQPLNLFALESRTRILENIRQRAQGLQVPSDYDAECNRKDGSCFPIHLYLTRTEFSDGPATVAFLLDITERKRAEEKIRAALEEKEILLREVHHRVKNNLQVIIALIKMQTGSTQDAETQQFLKELEGQAHTMALVYEQLYQSENLSQIDMELYLRQLTFNVLDTFGQKNSIQLELDAPICLDVAQAMPCGLIVNELFTNILKHAFPAGLQEEPQVKIAMRQEGKTCRLTVSDNGAGLPRGYDWRSGQTLGLRLVNLWATHQLGGTLDVLTEAGTIFRIAFRLDD